MKICVVADASSPLTRRWVAPLVERGHELTLFSYRSVASPITGVETVDLTRLCTLPKVRFAVWGWWLRRALRRIRPDILHARPVTAAGWLGALAAYRPFVVTATGSDLLVEPHRGPCRRLLLRYVLSHCDRLTAPTETLLAAARATGCPAARCRLVPWGVDTAVFRPDPADRRRMRVRLDIPAEAPLVLCPRGVSPIYNLDTLVEACAVARQVHPQLVLAFVEFHVDREYAAAVRRLVTSVGLGDSVHWLPAAGNDVAMAELFCTADVVASLPSSEGFGSSVWEALACGCPTVITDLPVFRHELEDGIHVLKVPVRDAAATARALNVLLGDEERRERLRRNAVAAAREHGAARPAELAEALYRELARAPKES
ncbi:MAG: glycosyltransferase family 4 protein [Acidobacteriota bacterium]